MPEQEIIIMGLTVYFISGMRLRIEDEQSIIARIIERWLDRDGKYTIYSPFTERNYAFAPSTIAAMFMTGLEDQDMPDNIDDHNSDDEEEQLPGDLWNE